jgi:hypothetical protein
MDHKVKISMKDTYNSQQTISHCVETRDGPWGHLSLVPYRTETLTHALECVITQRQSKSPRGPSSVEDTQKSVRTTPYSVAIKQPFDAIMAL